MTTSFQMSQIMCKAIHFAIKGPQTAQTIKIVELILENELKSIESVLKVKKYKEASISKAFEVDNDSVERQANDQVLNSNSPDCQDEKSNNCQIETPT